MQRLILSIGTGLVLVELTVVGDTRSAHAEVRFAAIQPTVWASTHGDYVLASGGGVCSVGEAVTILVTFAQAETGAQARGVHAGTCSGDMQAWTVTARFLADVPRLAGGSAYLCWNVRTGDGAEAIDREQRCETVTVIAAADAGS